MAETIQPQPQLQDSKTDRAEPTRESMFAPLPAEWQSIGLTTVEELVVDLELR